MHNIQIQMHYLHIGSISKLLLKMKQYNIWMEHEQ